MDHKQLIIIGAGRSGTNILRDVLTTIPGVGTWPCDEINYIWRHGNRSWENDEFDLTHARPEVCQYIRRAFGKAAYSSHSEWVLEKTCANSLRIPFINCVLPEAHYIFIIRDGRDVIASALRRWRAPLDLRYILKKARFVPPTDIAFYAGKYIINRLSSFTNHDRRLASWGPRCMDLQEILNDQGLIAACGYQWARCVELASSALKKIPQDRILKVRYENFVREPTNNLGRICDFMNKKLPNKVADSSKKLVTPISIGKWRSDLSELDLQPALPFIQTILQELEYV